MVFCERTCYAINLVLLEKNANAWKTDSLDNLIKHQMADYILKMA